MKRIPLTLLAALTVTCVARAALTPIPITPESYNADVVVEKTAIPSLKVVTTATVDQGTNNGANTWMEKGYDLINPDNGLPAPGTIITAPVGDVFLGGGITVFGVNTNNPAAANYSFQMPPSYAEPNGILIYGDGVNGLASGTFTLTTPAPYALLSFAGSGGNGGCVVGVIINHADGSKQTNSFGCPDWFNGTSNVLFIANERCGSSVNFTYANQNSGNPRIYFRDIAVANTTSAVTSIDLYYVSGPANSRNDVLAVSGASTPGGLVTPIAVTGYTYDFIVEADAAKRGQVLAANGLDLATTQSMDTTLNTGNSWYEIGYNVNNPDGAGVPIPDPTVLTNTGLPAAGSTISNAAGDHIYTLPPSYTANNAVWVAADTIINATITLATPTAASVLSLLASAGNGPVNNIIVINHADASSQTNLVTVPNWFDGNPYVYGANGRVEVNTAQFNNVRNAARNPRLYAIDLLVANSTSPVTTIEVINTNLTGGRIAIFAVSGTLDPVVPSFVSQPASVTTNVGASAVRFTASAVANVPITYRWQRGTNGVYVDLVDGGNISGATTTTLTVGPVAEIDDADYRLVATDPAGSSASGSAVLTVLSPLPDVTAPTDPIVAYQPLGGSSPDAEAVANAINNQTQKYLNRGLNSGRMAVPVGFVVTPASGRTIVTAIRMYTANDAEGRDPANYVLEGSIDGGNTWTLIVSNVVTLPSARNAGGATPIDPLVHALKQVRFANTTGYTAYRWYTTLVKGNETLMQIAEVELLGVQDASPIPIFTQQPAGVRAFEGTSAALTAAASGTPAPTFRWQRNTGGGFDFLADGGAISGSQTASLTVNPANLTDTGDYRVIASNTAGSTTSLVARVSILSNLPDITSASDTITSFGDTSGQTYPAETVPTLAIDDFTLRYRNGGVGLNAFTGFPPYEGPAGLVITPVMGSTRVTGLRIYAANDAPERDPRVFTLEGSTDGGATYSPIVSGTLDLPQDRNLPDLILNPLEQSVQEVLFPNTRAFTTYRLTINHVRDDLTANSFQFADLELLGVTAPPQPMLTITTGGTPGTISISSDMAGTLWSSPDLSNWTSRGPVSPGSPVIIAVGTEGPVRFYQIRP